MPPIKVLVVDDSALSRDMISEIISSDPDIEVIAQAGNGREAVDLVSRLNPDIVTMDVEMPVMNGLEALEAIMSSHAAPVLIVSSRGDAQTAYSAISKGALDIITKSDIDPARPSLLTEKIKLLSKVRVITHIRSKSRALRPREGQAPSRTQGAANKIVAIASSTGGPRALSELLSGLPEGFACPVVIAQHISDGFVSGMVAWLKMVTKLKVKVGEQGDHMVPGMAYVSPSEKNMAVGPGRRIVMTDRNGGAIYRPSCDALLSTAAAAYGPNCIGVILTGMGEDGVRGIAGIKAAGGITIAQDEKSSIVFGMPKAAIEKGCIDKVLPLEKIAAEIVNLVGQ